MSINVTYAATLTVAELLTTNVPAASAKTVTHSGYNASSTHTSASSPPVTLVACFEQAMSGGAATIDLRALTGTNNLAVDGNGLRVQFLRLRNKSTNANPIVISKGEANGYNGFGASFSLSLAVGAEVLLYNKDGGDDISGTNKTLDLAGTLAQVLECEIVLG